MASKGTATKGKQQPRGRRETSKILDLATHSTAYVTVSALAEYWMISRKQIYKQIDASTLPATRLGPRLYRIKTSDARQFEESAKLRPPRLRSKPVMAKSRPAAKSKKRSA